MLQLFPAAIPYFLLAVILIPKQKTFLGCCLLRRFISVCAYFSVNPYLKSIIYITIRLLFSYYTDLYTVIS